MSDSKPAHAPLEMGVRAFGPLPRNWKHGSDRWMFGVGIGAAGTLARPTEEYAKARVLRDIEAIRNLVRAPDVAPAFHAHNTADDFVKDFETLIELVEGGAPWLAVAGALAIGQKIGEVVSSTTQVNALDTLIEVAKPDRERGKKIKAAASEGGTDRASRVRKEKGYTPELLQQEVAGLVGKGERITNARRRIAAKYGISLSTMKRWT